MVTICCGDVSPVRTKLLSCLSFSFRLFIVASTSPQWENVTWSDPKVKETVVKLWISDQQLSDWIIMAPKPKPNPNRLGPPPQLNSLKIPVVQQQFTKKVQPKLREVVSRHIKILAKWFHMEFSWKKFLLSWMVLLIASKMVFLMLTYEFFTMTSLVSLEVSFESNFIFLNKIFRIPLKLSQSWISWIFLTYFVINWDAQSAWFHWSKSTKHLKKIFDAGPLSSVNSDKFWKLKVKLLD